MTTNQPRVAKQPEETNLPAVKDRNKTKHSDMTLRDRPKRQIERPKRLIEETKKKGKVY